VGRPHTRGVKCAVRDEAGRLVFVRHTYGDRRSWELPGGGLHRREDPEAAVRREMREELGLELEGLHAAGRVEVASHHKHTELLLFEGRAAGGGALRVDAGEIAEVRWASPAQPPDPLGPDAAALLALLRDGRARS
jgi:8-oxo-dGTP pyrophosphatase MutT (NUDIX family)